MFTFRVSETFPQDTPSSHSNNVGDDFCRYVRRTVKKELAPFSFWRNRRFRLYTTPNETREGKVLKWYQHQLTDDTSTRPARWMLVTVLDGFEKHDKITIRSTPKVKYTRGRTGMIVKSEAKGDKYQVQLLTQPRVITVAKENLELWPRFFEVHRMNIDGGGTLIDCGYCGYDCIPTNVPFCCKLSLEWIDPPSPVLELHPNVTQVNCPSCRAVEPPDKAFSRFTRLYVDECPICTETKPCHQLSACQHRFCSDCWKQWRTTTHSTIPISQPTSDDAMEKFGDSIQSSLRVLKSLAHSHDAEEGFRRYWIQLRQASIHVFCYRGILQEFVDELFKMAAVEILLRVIDERAKEIRCGLVRLDLVEATMEYEKEGIHKTAPIFYWTQGHIQYLQSICCHRMGQLHERNHNFHSAIHWHQRALWHLTQQVLLQKCNSAECLARLTRQHHNLGFAQKRAGFFQHALTSYNQAMDLCPNDSTKGNLEVLVEEMKQWTGTSGKMTPGC